MKIHIPLTTMNKIFDDINFSQVTQTSTNSHIKLSRDLITPEEDT